jgi:hypothetical protein
MNKPKIKQCDYCRSHMERYRADYPASDIRAYILIHARGCSALTAIDRRNKHRSTKAEPIHAR